MSVVESRVAEPAARPRRAPSETPAAGRHRRWMSVPPWTVVGLLMAAALVHTLLVGLRYHVGSFDDDASYILSARALAAGAGLTTRMPSGLPLVGVYPPGYPALLSPLVLVWGHAVIPLRALSVVCFLAVFPLTWAYLGRRGIPDPVRLTILALLAMSPLLATYGTMIMAEAPFLVLFLLLLLATARWEEDQRALTWAGAGTVVAAAGLLWLKEAAAGLVLGLVIWLIVRRLWRKAVVAALGPAVLFLPVVIARAVAGLSLIGSRYSDDLGSYNTGLLHRLTHTVPHAVSTYVGTALPLSIVPTGVSPLPHRGPISALFEVVRWTVAPLVLVGFVVWVRRHRDAACVIVPVYLLETLLYPYINERRVILVLPIIVTWYVLGAWNVIGGLAGRMAQTRRTPIRSFALPALCGLLVIVPLVLQFPRDYLYALNQDSPRPGGSAYMALLHELGRPEDVVETNYLSTTALYSGHRTANTAFVQPGCDVGAITNAIRQDGASFLLNGALNKPGLVDNLCILPVAGSESWAVRLYRTAHDNASVFELIGPGTGHPGLHDATMGAQLSTSAPTILQVPEVPQAHFDPAGSYPAIETTGGGASLTWTWGQPSPVSQVSIGAAAATDGSLTGLTVEARTIGGGWETISAVTGPVGEGSSTPYLVVPFDQPLVSTALRVTVTGIGTIGIHDVHVLSQG